MTDARDIDPGRFSTHYFDGRGFRQAYVREGVGGVPLLLVHGWPETKRVWWRVIEPLAAAGFEVIVPDLRGFGESDVSPDGFHDVHAHVHDMHALVTEGLGHRTGGGRGRRSRGADHPGLRAGVARTDRAHGAVQLAVAVVG